MKQPLVSVVMPNYNGIRFVRQAVESVQKQTLTDWELVIIDDCSSDQSLQLLEEMASDDARIRVIALPQNGGVANARNTGILQAQGKYIALLDNDDLWTPEKLERQIALLKEKNASIAYCSYDFIDETGLTIKRPFIVPEQADFESMLVSSVISCSTILTETKLMKEHLFDPSFYHEDYVLWMTLLKIPVKAVGDPKVMMHYRQVGTSRSHQKTNAAKERWNAYRKALGLNFLTSAWAFLRYAIHGIVKYIA